MNTDHQLGLQSLSEEQQETRLSVRGDFPSWLGGTLFRNGPGRFEIGGQSLNHWFDGFALLRKFDIRDGTINCSHRFLESEAYTHAQQHDELRFAEFGTNPDRTLGERFRDLLSSTLTDNASIGVTTVGDQIVAITETPRMVAFDPQTLQTNGTVTFDDDLELTGSLGHPHYDPRREEMVNYGARFGRTTEYVIHRRPVGGQTREVIGTVTVDRPSYIHSFALTGEYVILTECPFVANPLSFLRDQPFIEHFNWRPDHSTRFIIMDRQTGAVIAEPQTAPFFVFHHVNAFQQGDEVVVDLVGYDDASVVYDLYLDSLRSESPTITGGNLRRYRLPLDTTDASVTVETLYDGSIEFPMINYERCNTREYQYLYAAGSRNQRSVGLQDQLVKIDVRQRESQTWFEDGTYPSEPVFVPAPDADAEDAGVLLSVVLDTKTPRSFLLVLDAQSLAEHARAEMPCLLPFGFHGQFYQDLTTPRRTMA